MTRLLRAKQKRDKFKRQGLCPCCGSERDREDRLCCKKCRDKNNVYNKVNYEKLKQAR
jgi:predicted amidophosphoribosyltransferase